MNLASSSCCSGRGSGSVRRIGIHLGLGADSRQLCIRRDCPGAAREIRAGRRGERRFVVVRTNPSRRQRGPVLAEILKVRVDRLWCTTPAVLCVGTAGGACSVSSKVVRHKTVHVGLLDPFVNDGAGPGVDHLVAEDRCLIVKSPRRLDIAPGFGEEDWDVVVRCVHLEKNVAGGIVCRFATPV